MISERCNRQGGFGKQENQVIDYMSVRPFHGKAVFSRMSIYLSLLIEHLVFFLPLH